MEHHCAPAYCLFEPALPEWLWSHGTRFSLAVSCWLQLQLPLQVQITTKTSAEGFNKLDVSVYPFFEMLSVAQS
jgi:hypothetical protein